MRLSVDYMDLDSLFEQYQEKVPDCEKLTRNEVKQFEAIFYRLAEVSNGGWVSVKDRLPEYEGDYLVTDGHRPPWKCRLMILAGVKGWSNDVLNPAVKYWMPLPELPKEEAHE